MNMKDSVINSKSFDDDKINFIPSIEYLITNQKCIEALNELNLKKNNILTIDFITYFTEKHKELYNSFNYNPENYKNYNAFWDIYCYFKNVFVSLKYENLAREACCEYRKLNEKDYKSLTNWNSNYRPKLYNNICFSLWNNQFELNEIDEIEFFEEFGYKIEFKKFKYCYEFTRHIFKIDKILVDTNQVK